MHAKFSTRYRFLYAVDQFVGEIEGEDFNAKRVLLLGSNRDRLPDV